MDQPDTPEAPDEAEKPRDTSLEHLEQLTEIHLRRYGGRLDAARRGEANYRPKELEHLIALWREVAVKGYRYEELTELARNEVDDALWDEVS